MGKAELRIYASRKSWLLGRKNHIGGSDAASIVGLNPYKTNVQLWEEKVGIREPEDISNKSYIVYGTNAEAPLRDLFRLDYPEYKVTYTENNMYVNPEFPFAHASLDGELTDRNGHRGILEIKTTNIMNSMQRDKWNNGIPDNYYLQILHYLMVTGFDFVVVKAQLKSKWDNEVQTQSKHYHFERYDALEDIKYLAAAENEFWQCVIDKRKPALILPEI